MTTCPYCDTGIIEDTGRYRTCGNDHTVCIDDWTAEAFEEGRTV